MKTIPLTNSDQLVLIDDEDFEKVMALNTGWHLRQSDHSKNVVSTKSFYSRSLILSRFLLGAKWRHNNFVDHKDGNPLNNQKSNLRICTRSQNACNRKRNKNNESGYKGVTWNTRTKKWCAEIKKNCKRYFLGYFDDKILAAIAYDDKAIELHGEFAKLNFQLYGG